MNLSSILPPSDLLDKVRGVEAGLKQRKRLTRGGAFLSLIPATMFLVAAIQENLLKLQPSFALIETKPWLFWPLFAFVLCLLFVTWSTFWLRESRQPFRYTCSIGSFDVIGSNERTDIAEWMTWMPQDITRLLNERVQRFYFAGHSGPEGDETKDISDPYIHIHAHWVVRPSMQRNGTFTHEVDVMPRIRIGAVGNPEVMAQQSTVFPIGTATPDRADYDELLEQVYHCIVTEVYRRLEEDVRDKIALLPTDRYRAIALLFEADDYARSNSLHAYEEAEKLYRDAAALADPQWGAPLNTRIPRLFRDMRCLMHRLRFKIRRFESHYRPSACAMDLLGARALTGCARMLIFKQMLRNIMGKGLGPTFEASSLVTEAVKRISLLSSDIDGHTKALFEAQVTLAITRLRLLDYRGANNALQDAKKVHVGHAEDDAIFIFASGLLSRMPRTRLSLLRRAVERAPRFEVAQFALASESEDLWRSRPGLERDGANWVIREYEALLRLNPANLAAYASVGYIRWLLQQHEQAKILFQKGIRFSTAHSLFSCELDYGMARVEAETGDLVKAYRHYVAAMAVLNLGFQGGDFRAYYFSSMNRAMEARFHIYCKNVRRRIRAIPNSEQENSRIGRSLHAFVLHDLAEAHAGAANLSFQPKIRRRNLATALLDRAIEENPAFLLPYGTLAQLRSSEQEALLRRGLELEPDWPDGLVALARHYAFRAAEDMRRHWKHDQQQSCEDLLSAQKNRLAAMALIRRLLPHEWLWAAGELNVSALSDRNIERRWEREFNYTHVEAFLAWAECFFSAGDPEERALKGLQHVQEYYWPTTPYILTELLYARLSPLKKGTCDYARLVDETLRINPAVTIDLIERDIALTDAQILAAEREATELYADRSEIANRNERRPEAYRMVANSRGTPEEGDELYRKIADLFPDGWPHAELSTRLRERAIEKNLPSLLLVAISEIKKALTREPRRREYAESLAELEFLTQFGVHWKKTIEFSDTAADVHAPTLTVDAAYDLLDPPINDEIRETGLLPELTTVLRGLVTDGLSIEHVEPIVTAFLASYEPGKPLSEIKERVRNHPDVRKRITWMRTEGTPVLVRADEIFVDTLRSALRGGSVLTLDPKITAGLQKSIAAAFGTLAHDQYPIVVTTPELRSCVKTLIEHSGARLTVLTDAELPDSPQYRSMQSTRYRP